MNCAPAAIGPLEHHSAYLPVFRAAVAESGALDVMCSYSSVDGVPCSADARLLTGVLRDERGLRGFVRSDMCAISMLRCDHDVAENEEQALRMAPEAGVDMQLFDFPHEACQGAIVRMVRSGTLSEATVDRAVGRVLRVKFLLELFDRPFTDPDLHRSAVRRPPGSTAAGPCRHVGSGRSASSPAATTTGPIRRRSARPGCPERRPAPRDRAGIGSSRDAPRPVSHMLRFAYLQRFSSHNQFHEGIR